MQPNQPYTPNPLPPAPTPPENPYDFFLKDNGNQPTPGKFNLPNGNSTKQRALLIVGGGLLLLIVGLLFMSILSSGSKSNTTLLLEVAQEQTEIVRVANLGILEKAVRNSDTINLATNTALSVESSQQQVIGILTKSGSKVNPKQLAMKKNVKTDAALSSAAQSNNYDAVFVDILQKSLKNYQRILKNSYDATKNPVDRKVLSDAFKGTGILLGNTETNSKTVP
jgi:hypothetical protein